MTIPANVVRVMVHASQYPPVVRVMYYADPTSPTTTHLTTENRKAVMGVCDEVTGLLHSGQGEVYLFPWGWSYVPDQRTE